MGECFDTYRGGRPPPSIGELERTRQILILIICNLFISSPPPQFVIAWSNLLARCHLPLTRGAPGSWQAAIQLAAATRGFSSRLTGVTQLYREVSSNFRWGLPSMMRRISQWYVAHTSCPFSISTITDTMIRVGAGMRVAGGPLVTPVLVTQCVTPSVSALMYHIYLLLWWDMIKTEIQMTILHLQRSSSWANQELTLPKNLNI